MKARPSSAVSVTSVLAAQTHYEVLGLKRTSKKVSAAYKRACLRVHPDKVEHVQAAEAFRRVHEAYMILSNPVARAAYDDFLRRPAAATYGGHAPPRDAAGRARWAKERAARAKAQQSRTQPMSDAAKMRRDAAERYRRVEASREKARVTAMRREAEKQERLARQRDRLGEERLARQQRAQEEFERGAAHAAPSQRARRRAASMDFLERAHEPFHLRVPPLRSARGGVPSRPVSRRGHSARLGAQSQVPRPERSQRTARNTSHPPSRGASKDMPPPPTNTSTQQDIKPTSEQSPPQRDSNASPSLAPASERSASNAASASARRLQRHGERVRAFSLPAWLGWTGWRMDTLPSVPE
jgi:curved DNA-binding protein CbpA